MDLHCNSSCEWVLPPAGGENETFIKFIGRSWYDEQPAHLWNLETAVSHTVVPWLMFANDYELNKPISPQSPYLQHHPLSQCFFLVQSRSPNTYHYGVKLEGTQQIGSY